MNETLHCTALHCTAYYTYSLYCRQRRIASTIIDKLPSVRTIKSALLESLFVTYYGVAFGLFFKLFPLSSSFANIYTSGKIAKRSAPFKNYLLPSTFFPSSHTPAHTCAVTFQEGRSLYDIG